MQETALPARFFEDPSVDGNDQAGFFGDADKIRGTHDFRLVSQPPDQSLHACDLAGGEADNRLVENAELPALDGLAQLCFQFHSPDDTSVHDGVENLAAR